MSAPEWLIVGLGNPGPEYAQTRHNIGWMVVQSLVERHKGIWQKGSGPWLEAHICLAGHPIMAVLPLTYMNRSGEAVRAVQQRTGIPPERIIVVLDELNFPLGRVHLKASGSDGGHNGMASVITALGTRNVVRLRCGIGRNFPPGGMVQYVLSPFAPEELPERDRMLERAVAALESVVRFGLARAMSLVNSGALADFQQESATSSP